MKRIWVLQYEANEYDQHGFYSIRYFTEKPTLQQLSQSKFNKKVEELDEEKIIWLVGILKGEQLKLHKDDEYRLIECTDGFIDLN